MVFNNWSYWFFRTTTELLILFIFEEIRSDKQIFSPAFRRFCNKHLIYEMNSFLQIIKIDLNLQQYNIRLFM